MKTSTRHVLLIALLSACTLLVVWRAGYTIPAATVLAEERPHKVALSDDAQEAWAEVETLAKVLHPQFSGQPTAEQIQEYQRTTKEAAGPLTDKATAFLAKFPEHPKASMARQYAFQGLLVSSNFGDAARQKQLEEFIDASLANPAIPEDERVGMFLHKRQLPFLKKLRSGALGFDFQEEMERAMIESLLEARKEFPSNALVYQQLLMLARNKEGEQAKSIAREIVSSEGAPAEVKRQAQDILVSKRPYEIGKPLDIKFTAVDGRKVDLSKMKGKVVLLDFWATWCPPCVAEIPHMKAVYDKYHDQGFEIVGISFDNDKQALLKFVKERDIPWPHYFDGKGWGNAYGEKYGIDSIPRLWLIDKDGNLADINARTGLERKVEKLLAAKALQ